MKKLRALEMFALSYRILGQVNLLIHYLEKRF